MKKEIEKTKEMHIKFEKHQCEARIPQEYRKILKLKKGARIAWSIDIPKKELFGYILKEEDKNDFKKNIKN